MEQGWIKLHRQTLENEFLMMDEKAFCVFMKILMLANQKTGKYITGRRRLASLININPNTLYKVLVRLEEQGMITIESNNKYSVIGINNWSKYQQGSNRESNRSVTDTEEQVSNRTRNQLVTTKEPQSNNAVTHNKNEELRMKNIDTNVSLSTEPSTGKLTYKILFYQLVNELGYSPTTLFSATRQQKLKARLRSFTPDQLIKAAKEIRNDPHLQGDNDRGKKYGTIDFLIRNDEKIDELLNSNSRQLNYKADW